MDGLTKSALITVIFGGMTLMSVPASSAVPQSIPAVIDLCKPVIAEEYQGKTDRWNACVQGTQDFVNFVLGPPVQTGDTGATAADLVFELAKLYQDGMDCEKYDTELPEAIAVALKFEMDPKQRELIESISASINACQTIETGSIGRGVPSSGN
jgi:hypothetical protein